jgi:hypothetical protein
MPRLPDKFRELVDAGAATTRAACDGRDLTALEAAARTEEHPRS